MGNHINIQETIEKAREQPANEPNLSPALKTTFDLLIDYIDKLVQGKEANKVRIVVE
jgi:hypothetical protein